MSFMRLSDTRHRIRFNGPDSFEEIASMEFVDGKITFTGNADAAARMFFEEYLQRECDKYIKRRLAEHGIEEVGV